MTLLRIGDSAGRGWVSVRMLRHYHDFGLLVPEEVDEVTGYRLYDAGQVPALRRIVTLKNLGLTLTQVAELLAPGASEEHIRRKLGGSTSRHRGPTRRAAARLRTDRPSPRPTI